MDSLLGILCSLHNWFAAEAPLSSDKPGLCWFLPCVGSVCFLSLHLMYTNRWKKRLGRRRTLFHTSLWHTESPRLLRSLLYGQFILQRGEPKTQWSTTVRWGMGRGKERGRTKEARMHDNSIMVLPRQIKPRVEDLVTSAGFWSWEFGIQNLNSCFFTFWVEGFSRETDLIGWTLDNFTCPDTNI